MLSGINGINKIEEIAKNNIKEIAIRGGLMLQNNDSNDFIDGIYLGDIGKALIDAYNLGYKEGCANKSYKVCITERFKKIVDIDAENEDEAIQKVESMMDNDEIVFTLDDFESYSDRYIECVEEL